MARGNLPFLAGTPVGHYRAAFKTGLTTGLAAGNPVFAMRFPSANFIRGMILRFEVYAALITPFTAAQEISLDAYFARSWTVADSGGTAASFTAPNNILNSVSEVASSAAVNVATTGTLTAGTRTLDTQPFMSMSLGQTLVAASAGPLSVYDEWMLLSADSQFPFNAQSGNAPTANSGGGTNYGPEGIVCVVPVAQGAGGTVRYVFEVDWLEYAWGPGTVLGGVG